MRNRLGTKPIPLTIRFRVGVKCLPGFSADQAFSQQPGAGGEACQPLEPLLAAGGRDRMGAGPQLEYAGGETGAAWALLRFSLLNCRRKMCRREDADAASRAFLAGLLAPMLQASVACLPAVRS
jgi:hypothetical protein